MLPLGILIDPSLCLSLFLSCLHFRFALSSSRIALSLSIQDTFYSVLLTLSYNIDSFAMMGVCEFK